jgi:hypothetical protein
MVGFLHAQFAVQCMLPIWLLSLLSLWDAVLPTTLNVGVSGAHLYVHTDLESKKIDTLQPGAEVIQVAQTIEQAEPSAETDEIVIRFDPRSTWSASTRGGRLLNGTWSGIIDQATGTASGRWTLRDSAGRIVLRGTWSAAKSEREWRGSWRALVIGQTLERSGTWSSSVQLPPVSPLADLLEQAVNRSINGSWQSGNQSGGWAIRALR